MVKTLLVLAAPLIVILSAWEARRLRRWMKIILSAVALLLLAVASIALAEPTFLGGEAWYNRAPTREGVFLVLMLAGMAARSLDEAIEQRRRRLLALEKQGKRGKPRLVLDPWDFSRPFLVSVATFGGLLSQMGDRHLDWATLALSFQTGFFWQTLLRRKQDDGP